MCALLAGCGSATTRSGGPAPAATTTAAGVQQFQTDNGPFLDALRSNAGWPSYEQAAGDAGRLLAADGWPARSSADLAALAADYQVIASGGTDYNALSAALDRWKAAYDKAAGDLGLPQPFTG